MNILPHKSWHVYNKSNVEKVRKDEAKAKEEEDKKLERQQLADREARLKMLRDRANQRLGVDSADADSSKDMTSKIEAKHINFWEELESGNIDPGGPNPEAAAEQQAEREKWEKQITMYLAKEARGPAPWYAAAKRIPDDKQDDKAFDEAFRKLKDPKEKQKALKKRKREIRDIEREDPLSVIRTSLKGRDSNSSAYSSNRDKYADKQQRKDKEKDRRKHKSHESSSSSSIERLREQRIARERAERQRAAALVKGSNEDQVPENPHRYNSQFNPEDTKRAHQRQRRY
ncbi:hypothetical protein BGW37DRAFT_477236 [Umbelopsis sp. PMI_123]|nr:hypothetical protein BGW37DRAFT_477236 [Umbelopsis sp. PMI_123]